MSQHHWVLKQGQPFECQVHWQQGFSYTGMRTGSGARKGLTGMSCFSKNWSNLCVENLRTGLTKTPPGNQVFTAYFSNYSKPDLGSFAS